MEVLGDAMHLSATSSYIYPGALWPQKRRGAHWAMCSSSHVSIVCWNLPAVCKRWEL